MFQGLINPRIIKTVFADFLFSTLVPGTSLQTF